MSLYNISSKESRSYHNSKNWIINNNYQINTNNVFYDTYTTIHNNESYIYIMNYSAEPIKQSVERICVQSSIQSDTLDSVSNSRIVPNSIANLFENFDISKAKLARPINN